MLTVVGTGAEHGRPMATVRIASVGVAHPPVQIDQAEAAARIGQAMGDARRTAAIARGTMIDSRWSVLPADDIFALGGIEQRNGVYRRHAPRLAARAARNALCGRDARAMAGLVTSSCTGYALPGWPVELVQMLGLSRTVARVPLTEAGCAGGVVSLARAADFVRCQDSPAMTVAMELCTLSFHPEGDAGTMTANLLFGDGAGAAILEPGKGEGLEIVDGASMLVPESQHALAFHLGDGGFMPVIDRELADLLTPEAVTAATSLLCRNGLHPGDVSAWLLHPGGARILQQLQAALGIGREKTHWSWESLREFGNTSSAAIYDVLRRYMAEPAARGEWGVVAAFGPGVSIELLLVRRT